MEAIVKSKLKRALALIHKARHAAKANGDEEVYELLQSARNSLTSSIKLLPKDGQPEQVVHHY